MRRWMREPSRIVTLPGAIVSSGLATPASQRFVHARQGRMVGERNTGLLNSVLHHLLDSFRLLAEPGGIQSGRIKD